MESEGKALRGIEERMDEGGPHVRPSFHILLYYAFDLCLVMLMWKELDFVLRTSLTDANC